MNKEELIASFNKDPKSIEWRSKRSGDAWSNYRADLPNVPELRFLAGIEYRIAPFIPPPLPLLSFLNKYIFQFLCFRVEKAWYDDGTFKEYRIKKWIVPLTGWTTPYRRIKL